MLPMNAHASAGVEPDDIKRRTMAWIEALSASHARDLPLPDAEHAFRCAMFAGALFDALAPTLDLAQTDRELVVAAALWHEVGYARESRDYARKSFDSTP